MSVVKPHENDFVTSPLVAAPTTEMENPPFTIASTSACLTGSTNDGPTSSTSAAGAISKETSSHGRAVRTVALSRLFGPAGT